MEAAAGVPAAVRNGGVSLPLISSSSASSQHARKEWRVVSEQSGRNSSSEELERSKVSQSDERLIYEVQHGREPVDVDFCSITIDGGIENDILQQRLHAVAKQREELQQVEIQLRAQVIARSEIVGIQNTFEAQMKEQASANIKLQEQLREKEQRILDLERKMDEKERELHAIRLDNEAAWAKEDLLREQSKELQSYRRERDNSEAERTQHINQIHDLQEHIQEKERQIMDLQEQHRIDQETILFKDEQIREAQAWMTRAQEMDALQTTTNHTLQVELRERTEQYNQLWLGCQRQFGEMERLHMHIQQLQLELADVREKGGSYSDGSHVSHMNAKDASPLGQGNGSQLEVNGSSSPGGNPAGLQNGNSEGVSSFASAGNVSTQTDHVHGAAFAPSSLVGMPAYLSTGQVTALHPFLLHQQGVPHPNITQSHVSSVPGSSSIQNWQNQQVLPDGQHAPSHNENSYSQQAEPNLTKTNSHYDYESSANGQAIDTRHSDSNVSQGLGADSVAPSPNGGQVIESTDKSYENDLSQQDLQQISSHLHDAIRLDPAVHGNDIKEKKVDPVNDQSLENKNVMEQSYFAVSASPSESSILPENVNGTASTASNAVLPDASVPTGQKSNVTGKHGEGYLLDERALLAAIARTIGSGGRIRISSTLPNRLGKMLAPLHWHDYKKKYGKLDDFVVGHPEGDYIKLREGAQAVIAASAAVAKIAAAASTYSSLLPSVAVTPIAHPHRLKKSPSLESSSVNSDDKASLNEFAVSRPSNITDHPSQFSKAQSQNLNGGSFHVDGGVSSVRILSKSKDLVQLSGSESKAARSSVVMVGNGKNNPDRNEISQSKNAPLARPGVSLVGKQSRTIGTSSNPRR